MKMIPEDEPISAHLLSVGAGGGGGAQAGPAMRLEWNTRGGLKGNRCESILIYSTGHGFVAEVEEPTMRRIILLGPGDLWELDRERVM